MTMQLNISDLHFIYEEIFDFLNPKDLQPVFLVDHLFLINAYTSWGKRQHKITATSLNKKLLLLQKIQKISINRFSRSFIQGTIYFFPEDLKNINLLMSLRKINLVNASLKTTEKGFSRLDLSCLLQFFPNIQNLSLECHPLKSHKILHKNSHLRTLKAKNLKLIEFNLKKKDIEQIPAKLTNLFLSHSSISPEAFEALTNLSLKRLHLFACDYDLLCLKKLKNIPTLETLALEGNSSLTFEIIQKVLESNRNIKKIAIDSIIYLTHRKRFHKLFQNLVFFTTDKTLSKQRRNTI